MAGTRGTCRCALRPPEAAEWADATMTGSTFSANTASGAGGALFADSGSLTLTASAVTHDRAPAGGGAGIYHGSGTVSLAQTTVQQNQVNNCSPAASVTGCAG